MPAGRTTEKKASVPPTVRFSFPRTRVLPKFDVRVPRTRESQRGRGPRDYGVGLGA